MLLIKAMDKKINIYIVFHSFALADELFHRLNIILFSKIIAVPEHAIMTYAYLNSSDPF